jgi:tetratricopeptide (TPR) repeat protein
MDSMIIAAARALAAGDPLGALKRVALRDDAPALALRGIAMAQLGELPRAKALLRRAARAFGAREGVARARCVVAEAEVALAARDLGFSTKALDVARETLEAHGDRVNAAHARYLEVRRLLLIGRLDQAERALDPMDASPLPSPLRTAHELVVAGIAMRRIEAKAARAAMRRAERAARDAGIPALSAEVKAASSALDAPAARTIGRGKERSVRLAQVETLLASKALVVDACRHVVRERGAVVSLTRRPVLFALARALAEAWPETSPATHSWRGCSTRGPPMSLIVRGCGSRSGDSAVCCDRSPRSARRRWGSSWRRAVPATSWCWLDPSRRNMAPCSPCCRTEIHGRARAWRSRSEQVSVPCSARSTRWRPPARCNRSVAAEPVAGPRRPCLDSRRSCYSPRRCRATRMRA